MIAGFADGVSQKLVYLKLAERQLDLSSLGEFFTYRQGDRGASRRYAFNVTKALRYNTTLKSVNLSNIRGLEIPEICEALLHNETLTSIDLTKALWNNEAEHIAKVLKNNKTLKSLKISQILSQNDFAEEAVRTITDALEENFNLTFFEYYDIYKNPPKGEKAWAENKEKINKILMRNRALDQNGTFLKSSNLIDLSGTFLRDRGTGLIVNALKQNETLRSLDISDNDIGIEGANSIAAYLSENSTLVSLDLSSNNLGDDGTALIVKALKQSKALRSLDISHNNISIEGARAITEALQENNSLTSFKYDDNNEVWAEHKDTINKLLKHNELETVPDLYIRKYNSMEPRMLLNSLSSLSIETLKKYDAQFPASILQKEYGFLAKVLRFFLPPFLKRELDSSFVRRFINKQIMEGYSDELTFIIKIAARENMLSQPPSSYGVVRQLSQNDVTHSGENEKGNIQTGLAENSIYEPEESGTNQKPRQPVYHDSPLMTNNGTRESLEVTSDSRLANAANHGEPKAGTSSP